MSDYKDMAKILIEANLGTNPYSQGKEPKKGDWWKSAEGQDYAIGSDGEKQGPFNDEKEAEAHANPEQGGDGGDKEKEEPSGKLGTGDFDRDPDDIDDLPEPEDEEPKGKRSDRYKDIDTTWHDDPEAAAAQGQGWKTKDDTGFVSKNKPQPAKDLANDPKADTGPDSRGIRWDASYYGADDSAEWEDQYRDAEEDEDEDELAQIKWFGEKQGWGKDGELPSKSARTGKELGKNETLKINGKMYKRVQESIEDLDKEHPKKHPLRESYERIGGK